MDCQKAKNLGNCPCTYLSCQKKGVCCECLKYHLKREELPACCFSVQTEKTYNRSINNFIKERTNKIKEV
jgi:hypothetical protein